MKKFIFRRLSAGISAPFTMKWTKRAFCHNVQGVFLNKKISACQRRMKIEKKKFSVYFCKENGELSIVDIIGSIDDSIKKNESEEVTLLEIASKSFKAFFENHGFQCEKARKVGSLKMIGSFVMGQSPEGNTYNDEGIGLPLINGAADYLSGVISPSKYTSNPTRVCEKNDLIFCIRATIGNIVFADKTYCLGRGVAALRPYPLFRCFSYFKLKEAMEYFQKTLSGSIIIGMTKDQLLDFPIEIPSKEELWEFETLVGPIIEKFQLVQRENNILKSEKHFLLPLLLNGQIL